MTDEDLPPGLVVEAELSSRPGGERVLRGRWRGRTAVARLDPAGSQTASRAELSVLAAVSHPGLASLLDFGALPGGGGAYVLRSWVAGEDLLAWAAGKRPEAVGRAIARLCPALEHLHRHGFVHADLKGTNVIMPAGVGPEAQPVLTDFGLARQSGGRGAPVAGTLFSIAPELLLGGTSDARSDLFALGVLLHQLLAGKRTSAREFYGRFPREGFFEATATSPRDLPEWARDLVAALVERDPSRRPGSAEEVGRTLAGRLGMEVLPFDGAQRLAWPVLEGRSEWIEAWLGRALQPDAPRISWIKAPAGEDPAPVVGELSLRLVLSGAAVRRLDVREEAASLPDAAALDAWARAVAGSPGPRLLLASLGGDPWSARAVDALARSLLQAAEDGEAPRLLVAARSGPPAGDLEWTVQSLPEVEEEDIARFLRERLASEGEEAERAAELARRVRAASGGSASGVAFALDALARGGFLIAGDERPRLRPGALPEARALSRASGAAEGLERGGPAARMAGALSVLGGEAGIDQVAELAALEGGEIGAALASLAERGVVVRRPAGEGLRVELALEIEEGALLGEEAWRALHRRRARDLERAGAREVDILPHLYRAGDADARTLARAAVELRDRGCAELALELAERAAAQDAAGGRSPEPELTGERALAWCSLGQGERALEAAEPLEARAAADPAARAILERVRGAVAALRHDHRAALAHCEAALEADPSDGGQALLAKARLLYELRRDDELLALAGELRAGGEGRTRMEPRMWANLLALEAMSLFRRGEIDRARALLESYVEDARASDDPGREAGLRINLATLERRAGDLAAALEHFEQAEALCDRAGLVATLAQVRALYGGALREAGELRRAEPLLRAALSIRERLGDAVGATAVRGMLGLVYADRGWARAATLELERSADALRAGGRTRDAALLEVRAREVRARLGECSSVQDLDGEGERAAEGDPRVLIALARARWLCGEAEVSRELVRRADALGRSLGLRAVRRETSFLGRWLDAKGERSPSEVADNGSLVAEDERLLALLARAPIDLEEADSLADRLVARGRDDRAARLLLALSVRTPDRENAEAFGARAEACLRTVARGLDAREEAALRRALLGIPDPWPEDLVARDLSRQGEDELEMDVTNLLEINHRLVAQEDVDTLLGAIVEQALSISGAQRGFLVLEEDGELAVDTAMNSRRGDIAAPEVELSQSVVREALRRMEPIRVSNAVDDPLLGDAPSVVALELRSILCVPFEVQKGLRGVVYVDHRLREAAFDERAQRMLHLLADQAALAILQVRRLEEIRRLNRELNRKVVQKDSELRAARVALQVAGLPAPAGGLVGSSAAMSEVRRLIERAAPSRLSVLIGGASGTGKELAAHALHELSERSDGPFVSENCAALPASLIESELFGARRGAYTGAERDREGLFERAHGGTVFLDEIGELPLELQAKLLRVLETSQVRRLGDSLPRQVDFRLVVATNRDLETEVAEGRFRADLYYRLNGLGIEMPPLGARTEDIPELVDHWLRIREVETGSRRRVSEAVLARLCRREWPGNVRELFNELARLWVLCEGDLDDPSLVREPASAPRPAVLAPGEVRPMAELERLAIEQALEAAHGDKRKAAEMLGISRAKVYQRLKEWGMTGGAGSDPPRG